MAYQCIPMTTKEYTATLAELLKTPAKAKKFNNYNDKYKSITKAVKALEKLESDKYLSPIIRDLKQQQTLCREGMAKMLDTDSVSSSGVRFLRRISSADSSWTIVLSTGSSVNG
ncbi:MAG: hypothetical protein ISS71_09400 [Phycisphaerae bacterium]|nr:hypothetical protein [Phycisphaerae bacterium]